jgi:hypothetical protein
VGSVCWPNRSVGRAARKAYNHRFWTCYFPAVRYVPFPSIRAATDTTAPDRVLCEAGKMTEDLLRFQGDWGMTWAA